VYLGESAEEGWGSGEGVSVIYWIVLEEIVITSDVLWMYQKSSDLTLM